MPLINSKVELKLKWKKYCVLSAADVDNVNANSNNVIFTINDTKLYVPVVTLSAKDNQKLSKRLSKGFERSGCWNEYKAERENKKQQLNTNSFSDQILMFEFIQTKMAMLKDLNLDDITYQKDYC